MYHEKRNNYPVVKRSLVIDTRSTLLAKWYRNPRDEGSLERKAL